MTDPVSPAVSSPVVAANEVIIRPAVRSDVARMHELIVELAVYEKAPDAVTVTLQEMEDCGFGPQPLWGAFVADYTPADGSAAPCVIGLALYYYRYATWQGRMLYLEDFVVTQACRGAGVGQRLFDRVLEKAKEDQCHGMAWQALDWNEPALNFYRKYDAKIDPEWVNCTLFFDKKNQ